MAKQIVHTDEAPKSLAGYSQAVKAGGSSSYPVKVLSTPKQAHALEQLSRSKRDNA